MLSSGPMRIEFPVEIKFPAGIKFPEVIGFFITIFISLTSNAKKRKETDV